jgi:hypothetical protein
MIMKALLTKPIAMMLLVGTLISLSACEKALEVTPVQQIDPANAFKNTTDVQNALIGAYAAMVVQGHAGCNYQMAPDMMAYSPTQVLFNGTFQTIGDLNQLGTISTNAEAQRIWSASYNVINRCNLTISNLGVVTLPADQNRIRGEALTLRAFSYFNLVRLFARQYAPATASSDPGVPLQLTPIVDVPSAASATLPRSSVQAVYNQIIADLTAAETLVSTSLVSDRVDRNVVRALLARVYLQRGDAGDYATALNFANLAVTALGAGPLDVFLTDATAEAIWELGQNATNNAGASLPNFYAGAEFGGRGDISIENASALGFEPSDVRGRLNPTFGGAPSGAHFFYEGTGLAADGIFTYKWYPATPAKNTVLIRSAEMRLIRAECNFRNGTTVGATPLDDVNAIRTRAGATALAAVTLADIFAERHRELFLEGHFLYDVFRRRVTDNTVTIRGGLDPFGSTSAAQRLILPIPRRETDLNPNLVQNPGY